MLVDLQKLPLPELGSPSWGRYEAWLEVCRPVLEAKFLAEMKPTKRAEGWATLQPMGPADCLFLANQKVREKEKYRVS